MCVCVCIITFLILCYHVWGNKDVYSLVQCVLSDVIIKHMI